MDLEAELVLVERFHGPQYFFLEKYQQSIILGNDALKVKYEFLE